MWPKETFKPNEEQKGSSTKWNDPQDWIYMWLREEKISSKLITFHLNYYFFFQNQNLQNACKEPLQYLL